jgi:L-fuconolactonase
VVKLSGLLTEADWEQWTVDDLRPVVEVVLGTFGPQRTMWGSDWPVSLLAEADYATCVRVSDELLAHLAPDELRAVWADSARSAYGLGA